MNGGKDRKQPSGTTARILAHGKTPKQMSRALHHLREVQGMVSGTTPRPHAPWELGQPIGSQDQLNLAAAMLRRLKKAAKRLSTPEHTLENQKCQALCRVAMLEFEQSNGRR